jgi:hypothetical protein
MVPSLPTLFVSNTRNSRPTSSLLMGRPPTACEQQWAEAQAAQVGY